VNKEWVRALSVPRHLGLYYRLLVPLLSADNDGSSTKLEVLVYCKYRTFTDGEIADMRADQVRVIYKK
jgi:hypothetical protein